MKIDIITRHAIANYGSIFQSFATEKIFKKLGYETEIIDYIPSEEKIENLVKTYIKNSKIWNKNIITRAIYYILQKDNISVMNKRFELYRKEYLNLTEKTYNSLEELKINVPKADIYCTGSDQVWGKIGNKEFDETYFLEFLKDKKAKCISCAASFGKDKININLQKKIPVLMKKYSNILVREKSAVQILNETGCQNVQQILDPTLLLEKKEWEKMCKGKKEKMPYILIYQLHHNRNFDKYAKKISNKLKMPLIRINTSKYFKYKPGKFIYLPDPIEFLEYIRNANFILTDSFHGTVFSILFEKQFADVLPKITSTRITNLLNLLNLEGRVIENYNDFSVINKIISYNEVDKILKTERKKSIELLKEAIR